VNLQQIRYRLENLKGQRDRLDADIAAGEARIAEFKEDIVDVEEARAVIQVVAQQTQQRLEYHVGEIVSLAMAAVFDRPYALRLVFVQRRNKTEADIVFERDGEQCRPIDASGGGAVDVAAFALRVAMWSLRRPRSRNTLILDEPLKMLSRDRMPRAAAMIAEISRRLGLQIIMVSHAQELIEGADRYFEVSMRKGVSSVDQGRSDNRPDNGGQGGEQQAVDAPAEDSLRPRARRGRSGDTGDNGERPQGQPVDSQARRRRT